MTDQQKRDKQMRDHSWNETGGTDRNDDDSQTTGVLDLVADVAFHVGVARPFIASATGMLITAVAAPLAPIAMFAAMPFTGLIDGLFIDDRTKKIVDRVSFATTACRFGGDLGLLPSGDADLYEGT
jgi:hypothetical protein